MNVLNVVVNQIGMMYIIILTGFILYKKGIINDKGTLQLTNILLWIVNPMLMVTRYQMEFSKEKFIELVISLGLSFIIIALSIMVAKISSFIANHTLLIEIYINKKYFY